MIADYDGILVNDNIATICIGKFDKKTTFIVFTVFIYFIGILTQPAWRSENWRQLSLSTIHNDS